MVRLSSVKAKDVEDHMSVATKVDVGAEELLSADSESGVRPLGSDPVLAALDAAPLLPASDEEIATLHEIMRTTVRWIPHREFAGLVEASRES